MYIPKIKKEDLIFSEPEFEYDPAYKGYKGAVLITRKDGVGRGVVAIVIVPVKLLEDTEVEPHTDEFKQLFEDCLQERVDCGLVEINHEPPYDQGMMDDEIHEIRLNLGLETIL